MHKKIKLIIATSLILGAVSGILPANNYMQLATAKAYASSHDDDEDDDYYDEANLSGIYLSDGSINFNQDQTEYKVYVKKDTSEITIKAKPENTDYLVDINDSSVDKDNDYKKTVKLKEDESVIEIKVQSNDDDKTYTLNIYKTDQADLLDKSKLDNQGQTFSINTSTESKFNTWNRIDGKLKYVDGTGQVLKNMWWFDKTTGINYYLKEDGSRATGWFQNNNNWYYFNENGEMKTDWVCINGNWYYLNKSGAMKMGWLEDSNGNWYYLDGSGAMKTGWVNDANGKWYYMDATGKMIKDSTFNGYHLGADGALAN